MQSNDLFLFSNSVMYRCNMWRSDNELFGGCQQLLANQMTWRSIYRPRSSRRKSSCFTRKTISHPAHTSNLGKIDIISYKFVAYKYSLLWLKMIICMLQDAHVYQKQTLLSKTSVIFKMNHLHLKEHECMLDLIELNLWRFLLLALRAARASHERAEPEDWLARGSARSARCQPWEGWKWEFYWETLKY